MRTLGTTGQDPWTRWSLPHLLLLREITGTHGESSDNISRCGSATGFSASTAGRRANTVIFYGTRSGESPISGGPAEPDRALTKKELVACRPPDQVSQGGSSDVHPARAGISSCLKQFSRPGLVWRGCRRSEIVRAAGYYRRRSAKKVRAATMMPRERRSSSRMSNACCPVG